MTANSPATLANPNASHSAAQPAEQVLTAIADLAKMIENEPGAIAQLASLAAGDTSLQECLKISPEFIDVAYAKAYAFYHNQQYREALPLFANILLLDGRFTPALRGVAGCFQALGEHDRAVQCYLVLLTFNEFDFEAVLCLAASLQAANKPEVALEVLSAMSGTPQYQSDASPALKAQLATLSAGCQAAVTEAYDLGMPS